uniref:NADH-ubiquinone oxidoreductase chain 2 n=1 Tax=Leiodidae sp. BMNH 1274324 TaxID=1796521 RepID=A0A126TE17_9COLE|nr:NADH dehydrogenase subunit 2 [Leiodidae sp. BMNH 1274324]
MKVLIFLFLINKLFQMMFFLMMLLGIFIVISSSSWMGMWIGLEINLLAIIPLMNNKKFMQLSEASFKYFITQALASSIFLISMIFLTKILNMPFMLMFNSSILLKMGAAPFHFWLPEIMEGLNWNLNYLLMTIQKIAPFNMVIINNSTFFMLIIIYGMLMSGILGMNQISMKKIMAYSSINHISWMLASLFSFKMIWLYYFITYSLINLNLLMIFKKFKILNLSQMFNILNQNFLLKLIYVLNFLSLAGLPPFLGFLPKWLTIQFMVTNFFYTSMIMVILTLMTMFFYLKFSLPFLLLNFEKTNFKLSFSKSNFFLVYFINLLTLISFIMVTFLINFL